ncbi:hypothetical protein CR513_09670, partial [Mucuna pruriens]
MVLKKVLPNLKDHRGKWAPNYEGQYVVKQAFSRGALILTNVEGQDLKYPVNADSSKRLKGENSRMAKGKSGKAHLRVKWLFITEPLTLESHLTNKIHFQNAPRNGSFVGRATGLASQLSPWSATTSLNKPVPHINVYRTKQNRQRQKKKELHIPLTYTPFNPASHCLNYAPSQRVTRLKTE